MGAGHGLAGDIAGGPGGLEIEPAREPVDVEQFAGGVEAWDEAAFHGAEVDLGEADTAAGDEFILVEAFAEDGEGGAVELLGEGVGLGAGEVGPALVRWEFGRAHEEFPESAGQGGERRVGDVAGGVGGAQGFEGGGDGFEGLVWQPTDEEGESVIELA